MLESRAHPLLQWTSHGRHNILVEELDAAALYGKSSDQWFQIDREERALMIAHMQITRLLGKLNEYDFHKEWKAPK